MLSTKNHNKYLDVDPDSDAELPGYDSEEATAADSRTAGIHRAKRQKVEIDDEIDEENEDEENKDKDKAAVKSSSNAETTSTQAPIETIGNSEDSTHKSFLSSAPTAAESNTHPKLSITSSAKKPSKPGILYLSRIPPYMAPSKVRHHLSPFGTITNLFLTPEPPSRRHHRLTHHNGNKKRTYIDGWAEFQHRRQAKACAAAINGNVVGGKKGGWFRDDVWSVRYLKGFGWGDLMEGVRREEREREERVRVGVGRDKKEREAFLKGVEGARVERGREEKRERRQKRGLDVGERDGDGGEQREQRRFRQNDIIRREGGPDQSDEVNRVLSKIF